MKRVIYIILGLLVLVIGGGAFAISQIDTAAMSKKIADLTQESTGKPLVLQQVPSVSIMPLGVSFGPASWGMVDGKAAATGISVAVQGGNVSLQLGPLLTGKIMVDSVTLKNPTITVRPEAATAKAQAATSPTPEAEALKLPDFSLGKMHISNGTVTVDTGDGMTVRVNKLNVTLANVSPQQLASADISMHVDVSEQKGKGAATTLLAGTLQKKAQIRLSPTQVDVQGLELTFTPEKGLIPAAAGPIKLNAALSYVLSTGKLTLSQFTCNAAHTQLSLKGEGTTKPLSFKGSQSLSSAPDKMLQSLGISAPLATMPTSFSLKNSFSFANNTLDITTFEGNLDKTPITGNLKLQLPQQGRALGVNTTVQVGSLDMDNYMGTDKPKAAATPASGKAAGPIMPAGKAASLPTVQADIQISALTVNKITLHKVRVQTKGAAGRYTIDAATSLGTGGNIDVTTGLDLGAERYSSKGKAHQINVGNLLQAVQGKKPVSGTANIDFNLTCSGSTETAIKSSLSGNGLVLVQDIILHGISILPKDAPTKGGVPSNFERLQVPFTAKNGIVSLNPITLTSPTLTAKGLGTINLPQENLNIAADVALLGVTLPVVASGPFSNISYGLDPKKMLKNVLSSPELLNKGAEILQQKGGKATPEVGKALKGLFGK